MTRREKRKLFGKGFVVGSAMGRKLHGREKITRQIRVAEGQTVSRLTQERRAAEAAKAPWVSQVDPEARYFSKVVRARQAHRAEVGVLSTDVWPYKR